MPDTIHWCQKMFRQDEDIAFAFDCMRELNHSGNCDSPLAQEHLREWAKRRWGVTSETTRKHLGG